MPHMKVSLILTVLNEGEYIRRLLESVSRQSRLPDEVVVCDGGSTDDTVAVIDEYGN
ncbi:MAG: glycosyltransferase, partial [Chloroflexota bacterium]